MPKLNIFKRLQAALRYYVAVKQADKAHQKTAQRYYVMPNGDKGKLIVMDRKNFRTLKHKHYISHKVFIRDLEAECFYHTPYSNGTGALTQEQKQRKKIQYIRFLQK